MRNDYLLPAWLTVQLGDGCVMFLRDMGQISQDNMALLPTIWNSSFYTKLEKINHCIEHGVE
jgi:hypothetical protein